jgi:hypothetical protein
VGGAFSSIRAILISPMDSVLIRCRRVVIRIWRELAEKLIMISKLSPDAYLPRYLYLSKSIGTKSRKGAIKLYSLITILGLGLPRAECGFISILSWCLLLKHLGLTLLLVSRLMIVDFRSVRHNMT